MRTCLILEDQTVTREIFEEYVAQLGLKPLSAGNVEDAVKICKSTMPDSILLDWHMPDLDGMDFMEILKRMPNGDKIPVIMCTCDDMVSKKKNLKEAGIQGCLIKPILFNNLKHELQRVGVI
ncbi:MAG: response regulator receiver protein [Rickettsiaceae bacterium]|jgi:two-component system chemotaxis response regulator CheY|nr:response regulator receiver protein [Rickettsiaceae bacterium]